MIEFYILAFVLIASAVFVITAKKAVYSVVGLLVHFAALAIMYFSLAAEFLAVIQIIVYSGAILMLFLFVIALLSSGVAPFSVGPNRLPKIAAPAIFGVIVILGFLIYGVVHVPAVAPPGAATRITANGQFGAPNPSVAQNANGSMPGPVGAANVFGSVADFGKALFTTDLLPFEITAFILMVAVIGVILLAGESAPYVQSRRRARIVEREMREAILRAGEE
jgi:NADH-quinone oxidoreductase subunit J